jgi:hypothetical protein
MAWVQAVAEATWFDQGLRELPWWKDARDVNEIVEPEVHPEATNSTVDRSTTTDPLFRLTNSSCSSKKRQAIRLPASPRHSALPILPMAASNSLRLP